MKGKKLVLMLVAIIVALSAAVMVACPDEPERVPGPETGTYYYEVDGKEYTLMLMDVDQFVEVSGGEGIRTGTYVLNGSELTLTYPVSSKEEVAETKVGRYDGGNGSITFAVDGVERTYLALKSFDVTFVLSEGRTEVQSVKNGKTAIRPEDPEKEGYEFRGWYSDEKCTKPYAFEGTPILNEGLKIYARWVEQSHQDEYVIDFDLGYEAIGPEAMLTRNGKITDMPSDPTREGYTFAGWWISDYEDGAKLTVKYEEGREFKANTTLFAVWTANGNEQPVVSVNGSGISWAAKNGTVKVTVKGPKGFTALEQDVNGTVMAVNFGSAPAGDYEITVIDGSKSTTVYYKNKALDRVSRFSVDGSVLRYDGVANATRYYVSVVCGNEKHNHAYIDNDNKLYFDFTDCTMVREGIKFVVTAHADGYADSVSEEYVCIKELAKVEGFAYDKASGKLSWNSVENARSYVITVNGKATALTVNEYSFKGYAKGEYEIKVSAFAKGYAESVASEYSLVKNELSTPSNVKLANSVLSWDGVEGAQNYTVRVGNTEYEAEGTSYDLSGIAMVEAQDYEIVVRANAASASENSAWSDVLDARYHALKDSLTYRENKVRWTAVIGAEKYEVKVNNGAAKTVDDGSTNLEVALTRKGVNEITVRYYDGMRWSKTVSVEVVAYMVRYDGRNGKDAGAVYVAVGDKVKLPSVLNPGYEFDGWYDTYDGAASNGGEYKEIVYSEAKDTVLYADWTPGTFRMVYVDGDGNRYEKEVVFGTEFSFDPPASDAKDGMFVGWYTGTNGTGIKLTDVDGIGLKPWDSVTNVSIYPYYSNNALMFTLKEDDTYQVVKGTDIALFNKINVPATYNGKKVSTIGANGFSYCPKLEIINIPDSIEIIEFSTAFKSSGLIKEVNIYQTGTINDPRYYSFDGVLYANDVAGKEISYFPVAKGGEYVIAPGTVRIPGKVFYKITGLTHVTIPASVSIIAQSAFEDCSSLTDIVFAEPQDGEVPGELSIAKYAFQKCVKLRNVTFPARLAQFDTTIFTGCTLLDRININENCAVYASIDGIVTSKDKTEIVYCPNGRTGNIVIPALVTAIGDSAFSGCSKIQEITIPYTVTAIGKSAFNNTGITKVTFKGNLDAQPMTIGYRAFYRCYSLAEVVFEEHSAVSVIGEEAFAYDNGLKTLTVPASVVTIGKKAFRSCTQIREVKFEDGLESVDAAADAFLKCSGLVKVIIPASMTAIPIDAINQCTNVADIVIDPNNANFVAEEGCIYSADKSMLLFFGKSKAIPEGKLTLPSTVKVISGGTFRYNDKVVEVVIGKNVTSIGYGAFADNDKLVKVTFEDGGTEDLEIGDEAFFNDSKLSVVSLPERLVTLGVSSFKATAIESIYLPKKLTSVPREAFANCSYLANIEFAADGAVEHIGYQAFTKTNITSIVFPKTVKTIEEGVLRDCLQLTSYSFEKGAAIKTIPYRFALGSSKLAKAYIPASVTLIDTFAFSTCSGIKEVEFEYGGTEDLVINGSAFYGNTGLLSLALPSRLVSIGNSAFYNSGSLASITFADPVEEGKEAVPSKLQTIGLSAFYGSALVEVYLPGSLGNATFTSGTAQKLAVDGYSFRNSKSLKKVVFEEGEGTGNGFTLGQYVFQDCTALEEVVFPSRLSYAKDKSGGVVKFSYNTFAGCYNIKTLKVAEGNTLYKSVDDIAMYEADSNGEFTTLMCVATATAGNFTVPYTVKTLSQFAFTNCTNLTSVTFEKAPEGVEEVPLVTEGSTVTGYGTFNGTTIKTVELPSRLTTIGERTFFNCKITTINIPKNVRDINGVIGIGRYAFGGTSKAKPSYLTTITFEDGEGVEPLTIGDYAFYYCSSLKKLEFRSNTVKLGKNSVRYCIKLTSVKIPKEIKILETNSLADNDILASIDIDPEAKLDSIGASAFINNKKLNNFRMPIAATYGKTLLTNAIALNKVIVAKDMTNLNGLYHGATKIKEWVVEEGNQHYKAVDGILFTIDGKTLVNYPANKAGASYTIPAEVEVIGQNIGGTGTNMVCGFSRNTALTSIIIPKTVHTISYGAFYSCTAMTTVTFEKSAQGEEIKELSFGEYAFASMSKLTSFEFPARTASAGLSARVLYNGNTRNALTSITFEEGCRIKNIPAYAFSYSNITTIKIPKDVTFISDSAFYHCEKLAKVILDPSTTFDMIDKAAFGYNKSLEKDSYVELLKKSKGFGMNSFQYNDAVTGVLEIPSGITTIYSSMFRSLSGVTKIVIPDSVVSIENYGFAECKNLEEVVIPDSVVSMGSYVFSGCTSLKEVTLPTSILTVTGSYQFKDCTSLEKVTIGCSTIPKDMFKGCIKLKDVTLLEGVKYIGASAFEGLNAIEEIVIPSTVANGPYGSKGEMMRGIESKAFLNCSSIKSLKFAEGGTDGLTIGDKAFSGCISLTEVEFCERLVNSAGKVVDGVATVIPAVGDYAFQNCLALSTIKNFGIVEGVGDYAFANTAISEAFIPSTLSYIGASPYMGCKLTNIRLEEGSTKFVVRDGALFDSALTTLYAYPVAREGALEIPETVEVIGDGVFAGANITGKLVLPSSVMSIGDNSFNNCRYLEEIVIPTQVTAIGESAFEGCVSLKKVNLTETKVTDIGKNAFYGCSSLDIELPANVTNIGEGAFRGSGLTKVFINRNISVINADTFKDCLNLKDIIFENDGSVPMYIAKEAFKNCVSVETLELPHRLHDIATTTGKYAISEGAFEGCSSLKEVSVLDSDITVAVSTAVGQKVCYGFKAFKDCTSLTKITMHAFTASPSEQVSNSWGVADNAFENCTSLTTVIFPSAARSPKNSIGPNAFADCKKLSNLVISPKCAYIGERAFSGTAITSVSVYGNVEKEAFANCANLTSVNIYGDNLDGRNALAIKDGAFRNCASLETVSVSRNTNIQDKLNFEDLIFFGCEKLKTFTVDEKVDIATYGTMMFGNCPLFNGITVAKDSVVNGALIENNRGIDFEEGNTGFVIKDGIMYDITENIVMFVPQDKLDQALLSTVTTIGPGAYAGIDVEEFTVPKQIAEIQDGAFEGASFKKVTIDGPVKTFGARIFKDCSNLEEVVITDNILTAALGKYMFYNCTSLKKANFSSRITSLDDGVFMNCSSLTDFTLPSTYHSVHTYAFYGCSKLNISLDNVTYVNPYGCAGLGITNLNLSRATYIGVGAFNNCRSLESVTFSGTNGPVTTAARSFKGCNSLKKVESTSTKWQYIQDEAFMDCTSLETFKVASTIECVGERAFMNCVALREINSEMFTYSYTYYHSNNNIKESTFENCRSLKQIVISGTVRNIDRNAFKGCTSITSIEIPGVIEGIAYGAFDGWTSAQTISLKRSGPGSRYVGGWDSGCNAKIIFKED